MQTINLWAIRCFRLAGCITVVRLVMKEVQIGARFQGFSSGVVVITSGILSCFVICGKHPLSTSTLSMIAISNLMTATQ